MHSLPYVKYKVYNMIGSCEILSSRLTITENSCWVGLAASSCIALGFFMLLLLFLTALHEMCKDEYVMSMTWKKAAAGEIVYNKCPPNATGQFHFTIVGLFYYPVAYLSHLSTILIYCLLSLIHIFFFSLRLYLCGLQLLNLIFSFAFFYTFFCLLQCFAYHSCFSFQYMLHYLCSNNVCIPAGSASRRCLLSPQGVAIWSSPSFARCVSHDYKYLHIAVITSFSSYFCAKSVIAYL